MNARPRTMGMSSTSKYDPETDLNATRVLPAPVSAKATRNGASNCGLTAADAVTVASLVTAWIIAARLSSPRFFYQFSAQRPQWVHRRRVQCGHQREEPGRRPRADHEKHRDSPIG